MAIAFLDLDRTLLSINSGGLWLREEVRAGRLSPITVARAAGWLARYQLGLVDGPEAVAAAIASLRGQDARELEERTARFFHAHVRGTYRPGALAAIEAHRRRGHVVALLTSSSAYLAERVCADLKLDASLANTFEVDAAGRLTGRTVGPVCFGRGKLSHAEDFAARRGAQLSACTFYTDSYSDRCVLDAVGEAVVINPDIRLWLHARVRGWRVLDWGAGEGSRAVRG